MSEHHCLPDETIEDPVERLKALADCYWHLGEPDNAYAIGQEIIRHGEASQNFAQQGLGYMVCGDSRNDQHRYAEAWDLLDAATVRYALAEQHDEPDAAFHRARTAIGKLVAAIGADKTAQAMRDFEAARQIFATSTRPEAPEKLATLYQNAGIFFWRLGQFEEARAVCDVVLDLIRSGQVTRLGLEPVILLQIGHIYGHQGRARESVEYFQKALDLCLLDPGLRALVFIAHQNLAFADLSRGLYQQCLDRLEKHITPELGAGNSLLVEARRVIIECFLALNNYREAADLAESLVNAPQQADATNQLGPALGFLAMAQAELGLFEQAGCNFDQALAIFEAAGFQPQAMLLRLQRAQVLFQRREYTKASDEAVRTLNYFVETGHQLQEGDARLLIAGAMHKTGGAPDRIVEECETILRLAEVCDSFRLRYAGNVLLGHVAWQQGQPEAAERFYHAALAAVEQVQRDLALPFRPGFLSDKGEALRALVHLYLETGEPARAVEVIEASRIQVFLRYLTANHPRDAGQDTSRAITERLEALRQDFVSYSNLAHLDITFEPQESEGYHDRLRKAAQDKANAVGHEIRAITRKLIGGTNGASVDHAVPAVRLQDLQQALGRDEVLIVYYDDGEHVTGFAIEADAIHPCVLASTQQVKRLLRSLDLQTRYALSTLRLVRRADSARPARDLLRLPAFNDPTLKRSFEQSAAALYDLLIQPFEAYLYPPSAHQARPLRIVPYGFLHFVPFHLLYDKSRQRYLIQNGAVTAMPTASVTSPPGEAYPPGVVVIHDDLNGYLRYPAHDAGQIRAFVENQPYVGDVQVYSAREALANGVLRESSGQILHIIAHAQFDELHPELSFIQLDGQPLMMRDLIGRSLRYRLVVLTACETGRLNLIEREGAGLLGDDLVGIGRAFLYAGAQNVLTSRWLIGDGMTLPLLEHFYGGLNSGLDVAQALRFAQQELSLSTLHPVFWGVFQHIGGLNVSEPFNT